MAVHVAWHSQLCYHRNAEVDLMHHTYHHLRSNVKFDLVWYCYTLYHLACQNKRKTMPRVCTVHPHMDSAPPHFHITPYDEPPEAANCFCCSSAGPYVSCVPGAMKSVLGSLAAIAAEQRAIVGELYIH
jgi:hypothetical protein